MVFLLITYLKVVPGKKYAYIDFSYTNTFFNATSSAKMIYPSSFFYSHNDLLTSLTLNLSEANPHSHVTLKLLLMLPYSGTILKMSHRSLRLLSTELQVLLPDLQMRTLFYLTPLLSLHKLDPQLKRLTLGLKKMLKSFRVGTILPSKVS